MTATSYSKRIKESIRDLLRLLNSQQTPSLAGGGSGITNNAAGEISSSSIGSVPASTSIRTREQQLQRAETEVKTLQERLASVETELGQSRLQWDSERTILKQTLEEYEDKVSRRPAVIASVTILF